MFSRLGQGSTVRALEFSLIAWTSLVAMAFVGSVALDPESVSGASLVAAILYAACTSVAAPVVEASAMWLPTRFAMRPLSWRELVRIAAYAQGTHLTLGFALAAIAFGDVAVPEGAEAVYAVTVLALAVLPVVLHPHALVRSQPSRGLRAASLTTVAVLSAIVGLAGCIVAQYALINLIVGGH